MHFFSPKLKNMWEYYNCIKKSVYIFLTLLKLKKIDILFRNRDFEIKRIVATSPSFKKEQVVGFNLPSHMLIILTFTLRQGSNTFLSNNSGFQTVIPKNKNNLKKL